MINDQQGFINREVNLNVQCPTGNFQQGNWRQRLRRPSKNYFGWRRGRHTIYFPVENSLLDIGHLKTEFSKGGV